MKELIENVYIYIASPPLYLVKKGNKQQYAWNDEQRKRFIKELAGEGREDSVHVQRYKGLGEMNPLQLRETTMDPNTRRLVQLTLEDVPATEAMMDMLLAKKRSGDRKTWLEEKGNLAEVI